MKKIVRYLAGTKDKGIIYNALKIIDPTILRVDCYVDADFSGLFGRDPSSESSSAKSRTGFIIQIGGFPVVWLSKLQSCISLSTTEAEYAALSHVMRIIGPMRKLLLEILNVIKSSALPSRVSFHVHEDNASTHQLATQHRITSRTRHFNVKYHHFWEMVNKLQVSIERCPMDKQQADYLTKGLVRVTFEIIRKLNQGW